METKEFEFKGFKMSGFIGLFLVFALIGAIVWSGVTLTLPFVVIPVSFVLFILFTIGFVQLEPNEARAMVFFGKYRGTFRENGFWWVNPFYTKKKISLRARNLNAEAIKVNDKSGNPIMIGLVMVWKIKDVYKALFEIDSQTMSQNPNGIGTLNNTMKAFENFVAVQSDAALRQVAGRYNYDENSNPADDVTLRSGADEINEALKQTLNERLAIAGIEAVEARINYLAYAPEIAAVMLRRQQADAIIAAREKIVEGAVSMVKMALDNLKKDGVVELDEERKAAMVSNLLVVLCGDEPAAPVVNAGTLYN
ncbi:MAG: SPFH domain-containing protein [Bacteroidaceae bacterium]|nr:SPFH domain-containing protein [Bacteroidaceae bacterium]MBP5646944.1 SPFH domain-containing protein [Bacteroidaceae bacterium]